MRGRAGRVLAWAWLLGTGCVAHAQALPPMTPTSPASITPSARPMAGATMVSGTSSRQAPPPAERARVEYTGQTLRVAANDSSLNQILRDVSRATGMKITGGVTDERVFGTYGPGEPASVLAALLSGTGSNMLLIENVRRMPAELVLTPRQGGPSPPSPNVRSQDAGDEDDLPPQQVRRVPSPQAPAPEQVPPTVVAVPGSAPAPQAEAAGPAAAITTEQSPNGVKTPQQVYDQLMKLHQQQPSPPPQP